MVIRNYPQCEFILTALIVARKGYDTEAKLFPCQFKHPDSSFGSILPMGKVRILKNLFKVCLSIAVGSFRVYS